MRSHFDSFNSQIGFLWRYNFQITKVTIPLAFLCMKPKYRAQYKVCSTNTDRGMAISRLLVRGGGHFGFTKMPPD